METDTRFKEIHHQHQQQLLQQQQQQQQQQQLQQQQQKQQNQQFKSSTVNSSPSNGTSIVRISSSNTPNVAKKKEKNRIVLAYYVFALSPSSNHGLNSESIHRAPPTNGKTSPLTVIKRYLSSSSFSSTAKSTSVTINSTNNSGQSSSSTNEQHQQNYELDEESIALLCLPDGSSTINELLRYPHENPNKFHTFLITRQNGHRYYGSSLIVRAPNSSALTNNRFHVHCVITEIPFVTPTRQLLLYFAHTQPDQNVIQRICNLRVPSKGKCLKLLLPTCNFNSSTTKFGGVNNQSLISMSPFNADSRVRAITNSPAKSVTSSNNLQLQSSINRSSNLPSNNVNDLLEHFLLGNGGIFVYRGTADFPLLDYPLRQLFCDVLSPEIFVQLVTATLLEYQVLLISNDYYKLMLVSETLTALLAPFTWQHVYVPILPVSLGLHYLDAPTPYIMGLNSDLYMLQMNQQQQQQQQNYRQNQSQNQQQQSYSPSLPPISLASLSVTHTSQVRLFCDENRIEFIPAASEFEGNNSDFIDESLDPPPFLQQLASEIELILSSNVKLATLDTKLRPKSALMNVVATAARKHDLIDDKFTYLDDLKLNHLIRVTCSTLLQHHLLREYQKFIVTNDGGKWSQHGIPSANFMGGFKFDSVAFLSDQPDSLVPFMGKFLQTQMFASFIDDKCKKLRKLRQGNSNQYSNVNYFTLDPLVLTVRRNSHITQQKIHSIALSIDSVYDGAFEDATIVNLNELDISKSCSSPRRQRKVYDRLENKTLDPFDYKDTCDGFAGDRVDGKSPLGLNFNANGSGPTGDALKYSPLDDAPSALVSETNWRIVESLLRETKIKTKRILLEKMGSDEITPLGLHPIDEIEGNTLIASLCDLIERVWTHGLKSSDQSTLGSCSSFWSYTTAHCDQQFQLTNDRNDTITTVFQPDRMTVIKNGTSDSPGFIRKGQNFLSHSTPASPMRFSNGSSINRGPPFAPGSRNFPHLQGGSMKYSSSSSNHLSPLPTSLHYDVSSVASMIDVKTDHGKTRAFLRLALERKLLSSHLKLLCNNQGLLMAKYRRSAFLRAEDEREQFITHLLTLNAVDLLCFTNTFTTSTLSYRFFLYSSGPLNGSFVLSGTLNDSSSIAIEGNEMSFVFKAKNFGLIKFLTLTTFTSKVYVDFILIRNEVTGHLFRFNCNKWFGRNVDDDSCERVLLAEHITDSNIIGKLIEKTGQKTSSIGRQFRRGLSSTLDSISGSKSELTSVDQLKQLLSNKIDQVVNALQSQNLTQSHKFNPRKYPEQSNNGSHANEFDDLDDENEEETLQLVIDPYGQGILEAKTTKIPSSSQLNPLRLSSSSSSINTTASAKSVGSQIATSLGYQQFNQLYFAEETGLFAIVMECLYFGFKNRGKSPFRKQIFLWDYLLRIQVELKLSWRTLDANGSSVPRSTESNLHPSSSNGANDSANGAIRNADRKFIEIIEGINSHAMYRGKDAKALMFVAISIRNKLLAPHFIRLLSWPSIASQFYQVNSFLTNPVLTVTLVQLLVKLNQVNIHTDTAVTKGM